MPDKERIQYLLDKYASRLCTADELNELADWYEGLSFPEQEKEIWSESDPEIKEKVDLYYKEVTDQLQASGSMQEKKKSVWRTMIRYAAAAAVLVILATVGWHFLLGNKQEIPAIVAHDALPGGNHAVLTLANGQKIVLDSTGNGNVANQNGVKVIKLDSGQLAYKGNSNTISFNTLSTPRGGQYQIILPDGSKVWLNSASSLKYPTAFLGKERQIELIGEAYFEVAHNPKQPFIVSSNHQTVTVLGTHFNINSYSDEKATTTTLLEGRVAVSSNNHQVILKPGYAALQNQGQINTEKANIDQAVAWKDGVLDMDGQPFEAIMRQISRWYNVDIVYEGKVPDVKLAGQMDKGLNLSQLLKGLEMMHVKFKIEGRKLIVR